MEILIIGAAGMLGSKLSKALATGQLPGRSVTSLLLADVVEPVLHSQGIKVETRQADLTQPGVAADLVRSEPPVIYHLAAVVSGEAEADFEKGYAINFDGTRALFDAIRAKNEATGYRPRLVFTSSLAVFGGPYPEAVPDTFQAAPQNSYGVQKAMGELMLADYSRRGFMDGIGLRLPTISIRPGKPNAAASGFLSGILREPLAGHEAILPVPPTLRAWIASPRAAVQNLLHAGAIRTADLGAWRTVNLPGLSVTVADMIEALRRSAGSSAVDLIRSKPDATIERIVGSWPARFEAQRALELGFSADPDIDAIIAAHLEDEVA
ncbi:MAG: D-erythronate dehydrogenase [Pseudomonadota bacterium]